MRRQNCLYMLIYLYFCSKITNPQKQNCMKRNFLFLFIFACTCATFAYSSNDDRQQIHLNEKHDITDAVRPHRSASMNQCPITIFYCEELRLLEFHSNSDVTGVTINIYYDEEEILYNDILSILKDECPSISIASLPSGAYTIEVEINGVQYIGSLIL